MWEKKSSGNFPGKKAAGLFFFLVFFVFLSHAAPAELDKTGYQWFPFLEWSLLNQSYSENPYDLLATVTFEHAGSGEKHVTHMFYDGGDLWKFRFTGTRTGTWSLRTASSDSDLDGHRGIVTIGPNPRSTAKGFTLKGDIDPSKWVRQTGIEGRLEAFVPQFVMYKNLDRFYDDLSQIDRDIKTFLIEHGFSGFHVSAIAHGWTDVTKSGDGGNSGSDPDRRTFETLEQLITKTHRAGGVVHIWAWGDAERNKVPPGGKNSSADKRLQRYIAARLGPLPGWSMGYGFDLDEWVSEGDLREWHNYMKDHMGWFHFLGGRSVGPNRGTDHFDCGGDPCQIYENLDYSGYEHHRPTYEVYVAAISARPQKPTMSEDRFRIRVDKSTSKDYTMELTRRGLWHSAMAGGVANIWGNLYNGSSNTDSNDGSLPYPDSDVIKTNAVFFEKHFHQDMVRDNSLTDGVCLKRPDKRHYLFYRESAGSITLNLKEMVSSQAAVAVDTKKAYEERSLGNLQPENQTWSAPYHSDWALAVGSFEENAVLSAPENLHVSGPYQ